MAAGINHRTGTRPRRLAWIVFVSLLGTPFSGGQEGIAPPFDSARGANPSPRETLLRIAADEVRLDAVVVDAEGRQVAGLTAEDFEIYQDGQPQTIESVTYTREHHRSQTVAEPGSAGIPAGTPPVPSPAKAEGDAGRTMVFLIDDVSMNIQDLHFARMAVERFVESRVRPGDCFAIFRATGGSADSQSFSSDRRELLSRLHAIPWTLSLNPSRDSQIAALACGIRALRDVPGRKFLFLLSARATLPEGADHAAAFDRLADEALRAGVVIHTLDVAGKSAAVSNPGQAETGRSRPEEPAADRAIPLPGKTGGLSLTGGNFFSRGIAAMEEHLKGYYLLSYVPPAETFRPGDGPIYRKVQVRVRRPGSAVHARDGFYGAAGTSGKSDGEQDPLMEAMFSPFRDNALKVNLASGFIGGPESGYLLRTWLHLDGRHLGTEFDKDLGPSISLESVAATTDIDGSIRDIGRQRIRFAVTGKEMQWIRDNGLNFSLSLPAKNPGLFYLRAAVRDVGSGAIASAYRLLEIPDLEKPDPALSGIFILSRDEDSSWIQTATAEQPTARPASSARVARRSQASRTYFPGESFDYLAVLYNAAAAAQAPGLEFQHVLYGNGVEVFRSKPEAVQTRGVKDLGRIPVRERLKLEARLLPGDYVLEVRISDKRTAERPIAGRTLDFQVAARSPGRTGEPAPFAAEPLSGGIRRAVVDMTGEELRRFDPALSGVQFAEAKEPLSEVLRKSGERVIAFFRDFPDTSSKESLRLQRYVSERRAEQDRQRRDQPQLLDTAPRGEEVKPLVDPRGIEFCKLLQCVEGDMRSICIRLGCSRIETPDIHTSGPVTALLEEHAAEYNFFILPGSDRAGTSWEEDRSDKDRRSANPRDLSGFILSSGHTLHCMYLHPARQANSRFRYLGRERRGERAHVLAFAQKPESADYLAQYSEGESPVPVRFLVQGFVWIDPENYQILRMRTSMLAPERPTMLRETITDIVYGRVRFEDPVREFWLPQEINVSWEFPHTDRLDLIYRNRHRYSGYRVFSVDSDYEITLPESP